MARRIQKPKPAPLPPDVELRLINLEAGAFSHEAVELKRRIMAIPAGLIYVQIEEFRRLLDLVVGTTAALEKLTAVMTRKARAEREAQKP